MDHREPLKFLSTIVQPTNRMSISSNSPKQRVATMTRRVLSAVCCFGGLSCVIAGLESTSAASSCTEVLHQSKECVNAYSEAPIENASGGYCELNASGMCVASTSGNTCTDRFGVVHSGKCKPHFLGTTSTYDCYEDSVQTVLRVHLYTAECIAEGSGCKCIWSSTAETEPVTTCDCYDVEQD